MKKEIILTILAGILVLLFVYTACSKLFDPREFHSSMAKQPLPEWMKGLLLKTLPGTEIAVSILLIFQTTRKAGFIASTVLMIAFTTYVGLGLGHLLKYVPCTCGGVFQNMNWQNHFIVNIGFLGVAIAGVMIMKKTRRKTQNIQDANIQYS